MLSLKYARNVLPHKTALLLTKSNTIHMQIRDYTLNAGSSIHCINVIKSQKATSSIIIWKFTKGSITDYMHCIGTYISGYL